MNCQRVALNNQLFVIRLGHIVPSLSFKKLGQLIIDDVPPESCWLTDEVTCLVLCFTNTSVPTEHQRDPLLSVLVEAQSVE